MAELALTLAAYEQAAADLEDAAPSACQSLGGGEAILARFGGQMRPHSRGWWAVNLDDATWEAISREQQDPYRGGYGEC